MSDPIEILERRVRRVANGDQDLRGLHFFCQIGGHNQEGGMATLQLSGSGLVLLGWKEEEETLLFSAQLPEHAHRRFYAVLLQTPFWQDMPPRRPRRQGETNVHIRLTDKSAATWCGVQFWHTDLDTSPILRSLMSRLARLMDAVSEGELPRFDWLVS